MRKILALLLLLSVLRVNAQTPVQVNAQLLPPYSLQVSDYYSPSASAGNKINLILLNRDFVRTTVKVRLRMTIESQGIRISTKENVTYPEITLTAGSPYYVAPSELSAYFNAANLDFSGITPEQYTVMGKLPENFYTFCFEAIETTTGLTVSNKGCAFAWMTLSDPPFLNIPAKAETITPNTPQNIVFQWTPRHTASPNAGYNTDYVFSITEVQAGDFNPEAAFTSHQPLYVDSVQATSYNYGPDKPQLITGKKYAWRVQAKAKQGLDNLAMFRNNGYSEVFWFDYKNNCVAPSGITATVQGTRVIIEWQPLPIYLYYKVDYREKNNPSAEWFSISNTNPRVVITDLNFSKEYEYRVGAACEEDSYNYSTIRSFTTGGEPVPPVANCGDSSNIPLSVQQNYLTTMVPGDSIIAGDFKVIVTQVSGSINFTGEGYVKVPWLLGIKVGVKFNGIKVNTDKKLAYGKIETTYDPSENGITDIDEYIDIFTAGYGVGGVVTGQVTADTVFTFTIQWPGGISATLPPGYNPATGQGPVTISIIPVGGGSTVTYTVDHLPTTIQDAAGNVYQVNQDGSVTLVGHQGGATMLTKTNKKLIDADKALVKFVTYNNSKVQYAFDEWQPIYKKSLTINKEYEKISCEGGVEGIDGGNYYVSAKAIAPGKTDYIKAVVTVSDNSIVPDSIQFVNGKGTIYNRTRIDSAAGGYTYEIAVVGGPEKDAQEIYALYPRVGSKTFNFGKLLVASYAIQQRKLVLVPVNGSMVNQDSIRNALNRIYNKVGVQWEVIKDTNFVNTTWDLDGDGKLKVDGSDIWSVFSDEMKELNKAYRYNRNVDDKSVYLFVLNQAATHVNGIDVLGDMPRGKQFGYLFTNGGNGGDLGVTASHEVGHGAFRLKHIFDLSGLTQQLLQPSNVMDYPSGEFLVKYQWDILQDPGIVIGLFESDDNAMSVTYTDIRQFEQFKNTENNTYTFIAPSGKYFTLPPDVKAVTFSTFDRTFFVDLNHNANIASPTNNLIPLGSLSGFIDKNNNSYNASFQGTSFIGYGLAGSTGNYFKDNFTKTLQPANGIVVFLAVKNSNFTAYASKFKSTLTNQVYPTSDYTASGDRIQSFAIINLVEADKSKTVEQILNQYKEPSSALLNFAAGKPQFDNSSVLFYYKLAATGETPTIKDFLLDALSENSTLNDYITYFTLVNIKQNELQAFANCLETQFHMDEANIEMVIQNAQNAANSGQLSAATSMYNSVRLKTLQELITLTTGDTVLITNLRQAVQQNKSAKEIWTILKSGYKICALPGLDINTRLYILNKFLTGNYDNDNWYSDPTWYSSNDGHFFVKDLIATTPELDRVSLLKNGFMANNYEWLRSLWTQGNKWLNGVGYDEVHSIFDAVNPWILQSYNQLNIPITVKPMPNMEFGNLSQVNYPAGASPYIVGMENDEAYTIPMSNFEYSVGPYAITSDIDFKSTGRIYFKQGYWLEDVSTIVYNPDYPPARRAEFIDYKEDYNPFEPLQFIVVDNYHEVGFSKGDSYVVPAYMVMVYDKDVDRATTGRTVTAVVDIATIAAAIFAAPESGGTSLAAISAVLTRAAGVVAAVNIPLQYEINSLTPSQYNQNKNFYEAWEQIRTGVNYASLAAGGINLAWTKFGSYQSIANTFSSVKNTLNSIPSNLLPKLASAWNQIKGITPTSVSGTTQVTINESRLFNGTSGLFISNFDDLLSNGQIAGFDDAFTKAIFNMGKRPGSSSFDDLIQLTGKAEHIPTLPGGTAADVEILSGSQGATAVQELTTKQVLKPIGQPLSAYSVTQSGSIISNPASFVNQVTITKYTLAASTSTVPEALVVTAPNVAPQLLYATAKVSELIVNNEKNKQTCRQCQRYSQVICQKFEQLQTKAGNANIASVNKLCSQLSATEVNGVLDYLLAMDNINLGAFLSDILPNSNPSTQHIGNKVPLLNTSILASWTRMNEKKSGGYRKDYNGIKELKNIVENSSTLQALGGSEGINIILEKNTSAPCNTCQNNNNAYVYMDKYLSDVAYFANNYSSKTGYALVVGNSGIKSGSVNQVNATAFILRVLQEHPDYKNSITGFEEKIETINDAGETNTAFADIIQYGDEVIECKSWGASGIAFQRFVDGTSGSVAQFKTYLSDQTRVTSMDKIEYWFDAKKGVTETIVKEKFKAMMYQQSNLTQAGNEVFDAIWSNVNLRSNLFPALTQATARNEFLTMVSSVDNQFYHFIKVK
jgi:TANFOR domain-containing protein